MKRLKSNFVNMLLSLTIICVLAAALLSGIVVLTKRPIEESVAKKQTAAISEVLPFEGMTITTEKVAVDNDSLTVHRAFIDDKEVGVAVESYSNNGFNGTIRVMVGFDSIGNILNYSVLEQAETPGLGAKMVEWFKPQGETKKSLLEMVCKVEVKAVEKNSNVVGRSANEPLVVSKDGGKVDAITAATISSRAFLDAVNRAARALGNASAIDVVSSATEQADATTSATTKNIEVGGENNE